MCFIRFSQQIKIISLYTITDHGKRVGRVGRGAERLQAADVTIGLLLIGERETDWMHQALPVHCASAFRMDSSNLSLTTPSCACAVIVLLAWIISLSVDNKFIFVINTDCAFLEVGPELLYISKYFSRFKSSTGLTCNAFFFVQKRRVAFMFSPIFRRKFTVQSFDL